MLKPCNVSGGYMLRFNQFGDDDPQCPIVDKLCCFVQSWRVFIARFAYFCSWHQLEIESSDSQTCTEIDDHRKEKKQISWPSSSFPKSLNIIVMISRVNSTAIWFVRWILMRDSYVPRVLWVVFFGGLRRYPQIHFYGMFPFTKTNDFGVPPIYGSLHIYIYMYIYIYVYIYIVFIGLMFFFGVALFWETPLDVELCSDR